MLLFIFTASLSSAFAYQKSHFDDCSKYYHRARNNYLDILTGMNMPYIDQVPLPNNLKLIASNDYMNKMHNIVPSPVVTTKVLTVKTKYVYKNPVCVKFSKKQKICKDTTGSVNKLVTKQHFLKSNAEERVESSLDVLGDSDDNRFTLKVSFDKFVEPSEANSDDEEEQSSRAFRTPTMKPQKVKELLIEDRLDQLETILPDYHRRRTYETSTIYVTKTVTNRRSMATLVVKNCIPVGFDICPKRRQSKVAQTEPRDEDETRFYFG